MYIFNSLFNKQVGLAFIVYKLVSWLTLIADEIVHICLALIVPVIVLGFLILIKTELYLDRYGSESSYGVGYLVNTIYYIWV